MTHGRVQHPTIINESGLYSLILSSKMPRAKEFKHWVTSEILPTIRRTGGYVSNEEMFIENYLPFLDEPYKNLFRLQMTFISKLNERIRTDKPLVDFALHVADSEDLIDMNAMAKLAADKNFNIGRTRLFRWLKEMGVLMSNNLPYQRYIDRRYFVVKESVFEVEGMKKTYRQTFVTGKGQLFIIGLLKNITGRRCRDVKKPKCPLIGQDGNIFNLMGIASKTLKRNGMYDEAKEMCSRITSSGSYYEALNVIGEYVEITSTDDEQSEDEDMEMEMM